VNLVLEIGAMLHSFTRLPNGLPEPTLMVKYSSLHQGREIIAIGGLENGAFCTVFSENFHKF
jgi:hypothetical protein